MNRFMRGDVNTFHKHAKQLEAHVYQMNQSARDKDKYEANFMKIRLQIKILEKYRNLSRHVEKIKFDTTFLNKLACSTEQELRTLNKEYLPDINENFSENYDPLGNTDLDIFNSSNNEKEKHIMDLHKKQKFESSFNLLNEVYDEIEKDKTSTGGNL